MIKYQKRLEKGKKLSKVIIISCFHYFRRSWKTKVFIPFFKVLGNCGADQKVSTMSKVIYYNKM